MPATDVNQGDAMNQMDLPMHRQAHREMLHHRNRISTGHGGHELFQITPNPQRPDLC
ncbi:hypothetical protein BDP55DRAFT_682612 [Colletotrichum godetiae]|uniref:Uncharacterized protein n=1 Tax=Colletotrichum godetiae TaxID=1209918 RepID=A0AAJ0A9M8_9PEZI|nr:uncharacterized protein BDP55DRAFT_682612 [Colletotrichum godetiae]KAK1658433.1 hypothetical protein BDP55DRAFT_682612 [Colletotrichum godetiae]